MSRGEFSLRAEEPGTPGPVPAALPVRSGRPEPGEYAEYARPDIECVEGDDACAALERQAVATTELFEAFGDAGGGLSYGEGKWTVKQVLSHLADDERIFAWRALCLARGDARELPGFDEKLYVSGARFDVLPMSALLDDYLAVRAASLSLFRGLGPAAWLRRGVVNGYAATPRGLAFHIAGHELRHHRVVRERYVPVAEREPWWSGLRAAATGRGSRAQPREPGEIVREWVEAFNRADPDALAAFYAEDAVNHQVAEAPVRGRAAIREMFAAGFAAADMVCLVENLFEDGEWAILEWRDPRGLRGCGFFHVVDGEIVAQRGYWDKLSFLRQHGFPLPET